MLWQANEQARRRGDKYNRELLAHAATMCNAVSYFLWNSSARLRIWAKLHSWPLESLEKELSGGCPVPNPKRRTTACLAAAQVAISGFAAS